MATRQKVLLLFSGGRDSLLSACKLIEEGYYISMLALDNGCMSGIENIEETANRVIARYGQDKAEFLGVSLIAPLINDLRRKRALQELSEWTENYAHLLLSQVDCLICHTAMYIAAIAYCKAHNIMYLAEGARLSQKFFVELAEMNRHYVDLCTQHGVELVLPVSEIDSDADIKQGLSLRGFLPKVCEAQCWLGLPMNGDLSCKQRESLNQFYIHEIVPWVADMITETQSLFSSEAFNVKREAHIF